MGGVEPRGFVSLAGVNTQTRPDPSRSQRDELEQLQQELREARREIAELRLNNAALRERLRLLTEGGVLWEPS